MKQHFPGFSGKYVLSPRRQGFRPGGAKAVLFLAFLWCLGLAAAGEFGEAAFETVTSELTPLQDCLHSGQDDLALSMLEDLTEPPPELHRRFPDRTTLLHHAAKRGASQVCLQLIRLGANVNARDKSGRTPLMMAALWGHSRCLAVLALKGADLHQQDNAGQTALHHAVQGSSAEAATALIRLGADVAVKNEEGKSPRDLVATEELRQAFALRTKPRQTLTTADLEILVQRANRHPKLFRSNRERLQEILNDPTQDVRRKETAILQELEYAGLSLAELRQDEP